MKFAEAIKNESRKTFTENGATAYNTTCSAVLDLFSTIGSLREADESRVRTLFDEAYREDPLLATKCLFYARDIRGGLGERRTFRILLGHIAENHPEALTNNIHLIPFFGRYDDLYTLVGTPAEDAMWKIVNMQLNLDIAAMNAGKPCSLLAKWLKTADASSKATRELGIYTAGKVHRSVYDYKRVVRALRRYIDVVEVKMSERRWDEIAYAGVPSKAMTIYRNAFMKHDGERFKEFIGKVETGEEKINAATLYPYDIVGSYGCDSYWWRHRDTKVDPILEAQWKALPNYVEPGTNAIVVADTSGSMTGRPMCSAVSLAIYFAERNTGDYHGLWMSFSSDSKVQRIKGDTLRDKINNIDYEHWGSNTNLEAAFMNILEIAEENDVAPKEMVKSIIVISDMEIDFCAGNWSFYNEMEKRFREAGYVIPSVVFWNVNSRHDIFHADKNRKGVVLCSGQSASTFKHVVESADKTPVELMLGVLNDERYSVITIA